MDKITMKDDDSPLTLFLSTLRAPESKYRPNRPFEDDRSNDSSTIMGNNTTLSLDDTMDGSNTIVTNIF